MDNTQNDNRQHKTLSLSPRTVERLTTLAQEAGIPVSRLIDMLVNEEWKRRARRLKREKEG